MEGALARGLLHCGNHEGVNSSRRKGVDSGRRLTPAGNLCKQPNFYIRMNEISRTISDARHNSRPTLPRNA